MLISMPVYCQSLLGSSYNVVLHSRFNLLCIERFLVAMYTYRYKFEFGNNNCDFQVCKFLWILICFLSKVHNEVQRSLLRQTSSGEFSAMLLTLC